MKSSPSSSTVSGFFRRLFVPSGKPDALNIVVWVITGLIAVSIGLVLLTFLIQWLWGWLVPDLFPSAVRAGTLSGSITWWTAFKIVVALAIITTFFKGSSSSRREKVIVKQSESASAVLSDAAAPAPNPRPFPALVDPLTDRELEVLELLARGLTNQQIGHQLDISESTVVYHIGHIFGKLRVSSRVEAAVWAKERGII